MNDERILDLARAAASNSERFRPQDDRGGLPRVGDIRLARALPSSSKTQRLALVLRVNERLNHAEVCLLSNERDMASDFDVLLPRDETGLPFQLIAELDLVSPMYLIQLTDLFGQVESGPFMDGLQLASSGNFSVIKPALRGLPIRGQADPRWAFKENELSALQELSRQCTWDLVEERISARPIIDPALVAEVVDSAGADPAERTEGLILLAEAAQGGVALPEQISELLDQLQELFMADPTFQIAIQPLLEAAISATIKPPTNQEISFVPRRRESESRRHQLGTLVASVAGPGSASFVRVLTTARAWEVGLSSRPWVEIEFPDRDPMYAQARDPRRAARCAS
jgi:hypothetical protein